MAIILSGKEVAQASNERTMEKCLAFEKKTGRKPCLAVILVGENPESQTYVASKKKSCDKVGFNHRDITLDSSTTQEELLKVINNLNNDPLVDGILVQLPLPKAIDENSIIEAINPKKDVDGFHPENVGNLLLGRKTLVSCTPKGVLRILDYYKIDTEGKNVVIIGRSNIVGKPMASLLIRKDRNATVTICHTGTINLKEITLKADIIIVAVGVVNTLTSDMVKDGAIVIDVGITRVPDSSKKSGYAIKGDADYEGLFNKVKAITPVPGGCGLMTVAMLMENTLEAAMEREGLCEGDL
ncbi:MAG: bifunctional 5,10-methylenetetrahydrofolate dehydrogenase/5,10-methenyltetrahydrofolate cyclohydrolase [Sphaerochaetaceae bacterium]|nr:bifunctional 5,10-methylenetetrahydrofolate dehydrogenase/5,10-methenyltetrahydrofolate cyclohydrolase [Sphaerochaetaceae bacterium]